MHIVLSERKGWGVVGALALICVFGFLGLRAADELSDTLAPPPPLPNPPLNVAEANKDAEGNIKVHEQGTVQVTGTVNVGNNPSVQDVRVTNDPLEVEVTNTLVVESGTVRKFHQEIFPFDKDEDFVVDIAEFSRVRLQTTVNGSDSTVDFIYETDGGASGSFSVDTGGPSKSVLLPEVAGTRLHVYVRDPDGEQVFVNVFGTY